MKRGTVTGEIKSILGELGIKINYWKVFSDTYPKGRVGVKFSEVYLDPTQKDIVKTKMEERGFKYSFIKENLNSDSEYEGTRFCFYNREYVN